MYNLDVRDETFWLLEVRKSWLLKEASFLQAVYMGMSGGEKSSEYLNRIWDEYYLLEGVDLEQDRIDANWGWLKMKKRG